MSAGIRAVGRFRRKRGFASPLWYMLLEIGIYCTTYDHIMDTILVQLRQVAAVALIVTTEYGCLLFIYVSSNPVISHRHHVVSLTKPASVWPARPDIMVHDEAAELNPCVN